MCKREGGTETQKQREGYLDRHRDRNEWTEKGRKTGTETDKKKDIDRVRYSRKKRKAA